MSGITGNQPHQVRSPWWPAVWPHAGFVLVYVLWGINISSLKIGGHDWNPLVFNGFRYIFIVPFLWLYALWYFRRRQLRMQIAGRDLLLICGLGVLSAIGMEAMLQYALQFSNAANGAVLGRGFMPVITVLLSLLLREIRIGWSIAVGLPVAFIGVLLIVSGGAGGFHLGADTLRGDLLLLLRSFLGAIYLIGMNRLVAKYPLPLLLSIEMTAGALALLPFVLVLADARYLANISAIGWGSLVYTAFFATLVGFAIHNASLARLGPFKSSAYGYLLPVTAAIGGWLLLGEAISSYQYVGGALILIAMYVVQRDRMKSRHRSPESVPSTQ